MQVLSYERSALQWPSLVMLNLPEIASAFGGGVQFRGPLKAQDDESTIIKIGHKERRNFEVGVMVRLTWAGRRTVNCR